MDIEDAPETFLNSDFKDEVRNSPWWIELKDKNLNRFMDQAFQSNLAIEQAFYRMERLRAMKAAGYSSLYPTINLSGAVQENGEISESEGAAGQIRTSMELPTYDFKLLTRYELDVWGKLAAQRGAAKADLLAGKADLNAVFLSISAQIARVYYSIVEMQHQLDLQSKIINANQSYLEMVSDRYTRGVTVSMDVYRAEISLSNAKAGKQQLETQYAQLQHTFSLFFGEYPKMILDEDPELAIPDSISKIPTGLPSELVERRPDVAAAYHRMRAADKRWAEAVMNRLPSLSLSAQVGGNDNEIQNAIDYEQMAWNAIANLTAPLFAGGKLKAGADAAEASFKEAASRYVETTLNAFREVEDALVKIQNQKEFLIEVEQQIKSSENLLKTTTDRYLRGLTDYLNVTSAQTSYFNARSGYIKAKHELVEAHINLATALGGAWTEDFSGKYAAKKETDK